MRCGGSKAVWFYKNRLNKSIAYQSITANRLPGYTMKAINHEQVLFKRPAHFPLNIFFA